MSGEFGTNWLDLSSVSNKCISTYYRGFVDISGGPLYLRNDSLYIKSGDISLNGRLYVANDVSIGNRLFVAGDVSINGNLFATTQTSTDDSTLVATTAFVKNAFANPSIIFTGDLDVSDRLFVGSDALFAANVDISGVLTKGGGSFDIEHPDPSKPPGTRLRHCFVESPTRGDNIYRFRVETVDLSATLLLPSYYKFLNEDTQILVTPINCFGAGFGTLGDDGETVSIEVSLDGKYNVVIIGTRKDQMMVDYFDNTGGAEYVL